MNKTYMLLAAAACAALAGTADAVTDDEIRATLRQLWTVSVCGADRDGRHASRAPALPGTEWFDADTNRLVRIMCELAQTNSAWNAEVIMSRVGRYATTNELPILYSCVTNPICGDGAVQAIICIEGLSSNTVAVAREYLFLTNDFPSCKEHDRMYLCSKIMHDVKNNPGLSNIRPYVMGVALDFAEHVNRDHWSSDKALCGFDPTYKYSRRRLRIMRSAQSTCQGDFLLNYVTNAINELVAYPESELPE